MTLKDTLRPPAEKPRYHHGALHDALLGAAEAELAASLADAPDALKTALARLGRAAMSRGDGQD